MKFSDASKLLRDAGRDAHILRSGSEPGCVLVSSELMGRVVAASLDGDSGEIVSYVNKDQFLGRSMDIWKNWGGESRQWFGPEGGEFGLMLMDMDESPGEYSVPDALSETAYEVVPGLKSDSSMTLRSRISLRNAAGTWFEVETRKLVTVLDDSLYAAGHSVETAGFAVESTVTNVGDNPWTRKTGALCQWHIGQFMPGPGVIAIVPYRQGDLCDPPIREDYFRHVCLDARMPGDHYRIRDGAALFKADGKVSTKIGQNVSRATGILGSIDLESDRLILIDYDLFPGIEYASGYWTRQADPYNGDCVSFYCEGPLTSEVGNGRFYEMEVMSPAMFLSPGHSFTFRTRTMHIRGKRPALSDICWRNLGVQMPALLDFDRQSRVRAA